MVICVQLGPFIGLILQTLYKGVTKKYNHDNHGFWGYWFRGWYQKLKKFNPGVRNRTWHIIFIWLLLTLLGPGTEEKKIEGISIVFLSSLNIQKTEKKFEREVGDGCQKDYSFFMSKTVIFRSELLEKFENTIFLVRIKKK